MNIKKLNKILILIGIFGIFLVINVKDMKIKDFNLGENVVLSYKDKIKIKTDEIELLNIKELVKKYI